LITEFQFHLVLIKKIEHILSLSYPALVRKTLYKIL